MEVSGQLHAPTALPQPPVPIVRILGWVGAEAGLNFTAAWEIFSPCLESKPNSTAVQPVARLLISLNIINKLVSITEKECISCEVETEI
jgi:hypothetical protein